MALRLQEEGAAAVATSNGTVTRRTRTKVGLHACIARPLGGASMPGMDGRGSVGCLARVAGHHQVTCTLLQQGVTVRVPVAAPNYTGPVPTVCCGYTSGAGRGDSTLHA